MHVFPVENLFVSLMLLNNTFLNTTETNKSRTVDEKQLMMERAESHQAYGTTEAHQAYGTTESHQTYGTTICQPRVTTRADIQYGMRTSTINIYHNQTSSKENSQYTKVHRTSPTRTCITSTPETSPRNTHREGNDSYPNCAPAYSVHGPLVYGNTMPNNVNTECVTESSTLPSVKSYPLINSEKDSGISNNKTSNNFDHQIVQNHNSSTTYDHHTECFPPVWENKTFTNCDEQLSNKNKNTPATRKPSTTSCSAQVSLESSQSFPCSEIHNVPTSNYLIKSYDLNCDTNVTDTKVGHNMSNGLTNFTLVQEIVCIPKRNGTTKSTKYMTSNDQWARDNNVRPVTISQCDKHKGVLPSTRNTQVYNNFDQSRKPGPILIHVFQKANAFRGNNHKVDPWKVDENKIPMLPIIRLPDAIGDGNDNIRKILNSMRGKLIERETSRGRRPNLILQRRDPSPMRTISSKNFESLRPLSARYQSNYNRLSQHQFPFVMPEKYSQGDGYQQFYTGSKSLKYPQMLTLNNDSLAS